MMPTSLNNIFLTGFMGAGKSTIAPLLARALGRDFVDLDRAIEAATGKSVAEIFSTFSEVRFRELEAEALTDLSRRRGLVIALGGGTLLREENRERISESGILVYLEAPLSILQERIAGDCQARPLAREEKLAEVFDSRVIYYQSAPIHVKTEGKYPAEIVEEILESLA